MRNGSVIGDLGVAQVGFSVGSPAAAGGCGSAHVV